MANYHHQWLYVADAFGTPAELFNGARLARNLQAASLCGSGRYDNVLANAGCDGYLYAPTAPAALNDAVLWLDAVDGSPSRQYAPNRGIGGPQLNATLGATTTASTDEPLWLGGAEKYLYVSSGSGNNASVPDTAALKISGDIEIIVRYGPTFWDPATDQPLISKYAATTAGYEFRLNFDATLGFSARLAASDIVVASTVIIPVPPAVDGKDLWLKVTRVSSTGVIKFWYAVGGDNTIPTAWSQLGADVTTTSGNITTGTQTLVIGARTGGNQGPGKYFRAIIRNAIDASTPANVLDVDFTTNTRQNDFVATAGGTVTINRASTGRKTVMYQGRPLWLFGTDDFMTIADHPLLDFAANEPMTVIAIQRVHNVAVGSVQAIIAKQTGSGAVGWGLYNGTAAASTADVHDGTLTGTANTANKTAGTLHAVGATRSITSDSVIPYLDGVAGTPGTDNTTATIANTQPTRIGGFSAGASPLDAEISAVLVWRRQLTAAEFADVSTFFTSANQALAQCWTSVDFSAGANPWYTATNAASAEAYGFYIEDWTGLDGAHHTRSITPTGQNRGGALYGPQSANPRAWKMNVILHGSSERGLEYLFRWLESTLLNSCGTNCGTQFAWIRQVCPNDPSVTPQEGVARAERVVLLEGPTWEAPPAVDGGCYIRRVSFTLGIGDPCLYREAAPLAYGEVTTSGTGTGNVLSNCATFNGDSRQVRAVMSGPDTGYGVRAPIVTITSPAESGSSTRKGLPVLRIVGYDDPLGYGNPCQANQIGELILEGYETSGYEIVIDMAKRRVRMRPVGTTEWLDGSRLIGKALRSGVTRWWSFGSCNSGLVVVEPAFTNLETNRVSATSLQVSQWSVRIESGDRFGCV